MKRTDDPKPTSPPDEREELAPADDAIIARAFRRSVIAIVTVALISGGAVWWARRKAAAPQPKMTPLTAPVTASHGESELPEAKFTDSTSAAGITFVHNTGAYGEKLLPETMGGGVAFLDFDGDGDQDVLFINATYWPWKAGPKPTTMALYRNDGQGHFADVTVGSGLDLSLYGMGVAVGDYDNDGLVDIFVTAVGGNHLFHNQGSGKFAEVTAPAGVGGVGTDWSTSAAWIDYDNDGKLDLFVCNYVRWSREIDAEVGYKIDGTTRAYGPPMNFQGAFPYLYHNEGNGRFADISAAAGVQVKNPVTGVPAAKSLGVAPVDFDDDGWIDLVVANDTTPNFLFHNQRNGTFKEMGALAGLAFDSYGNTRGAMGIDAAYYRNDDTLGIVIGNFANEMTALYVSHRSATSFTDDAIPEGVGPASRLWLKFGVFFFDYDLDGRLDLLSANGHLEEEISKIQQSQRYAQPAQLFWNSGAGRGPCFVPATAAKCGEDLFKPIVGRGSAFADIDGDGDLDLVLTQVNGRPLLLRNDESLGRHWLRLKLVGRKCNRDAIGAWVKVRVGPQTLSRQVMPTRSYLSQSELPVTVGLGESRSYDDLEVIWPGGQKQHVTNARIDGLTVIEQAP
jgi:hypothetical protein